MNELITLESRLKNPRPLLVKIGGYLLISTKERFRTETAPSGARWQANAPATIRSYLLQRGGGYKKDGSLNARGVRLAGSKKVLTGISKSLANQINYSVSSDGKTLYVGSTMVYGRIQQKGGMAGRGNKVKIPARPFLGLSASDTAKIQTYVAGYLSGS
jgi:phage virion morphogenesis protein